MRTYSSIKNLWSIRKWLKAWLISRKQTLNSREAAIYLNTSLRVLYQLTGDDHLPFHRTKTQLLLFKKSEIDRWLMIRHTPGFPLPTRKPRTRKLRFNNGG